VAPFGVWYVSSRLLKRILDYLYCFVYQLKKHRWLNGRAVCPYCRPPSWIGIVWFSGGLKVLVVG
jgi:hypothetical protein